MRVLRRVFIAASVAWTAALPATAWMANRGDASPLAYACVATLYVIGSMVCHQLPARSFHLGVSQFPVCARCTGIYLGAAVIALVGHRFSVALPRTRALLVAAVVPSAATLIYEWTTGDVPSNAIRFAAGLPLGAAAAWVVAASLGDGNRVN